MASNIGSMLKRVDSMMQSDEQLKDEADEKASIDLAISFTVDGLKQSAQPISSPVFLRRRAETYPRASSREVSRVLSAEDITSMLVLRCHKDELSRRMGVCEDSPLDRVVLKKIINNLMKIRNMRLLCGDE